MVGLNYYTSAEAALVGSVLFEPKIVGDVMIRVKPEDFDDSDLRTVYSAVRAVWQQGRPVDPVTVRDLAGAQYEELIRSCMVASPTAANWKAHADIVCKNARLRRMKAAADKILNAMDVEETSAPIAELNRCTAERPAAQIVSLSDGLAELYSRLCAQTPPSYVKFGIPAVDGRTYKELGDVVVIAGEPSSGKTLFATQIALELCRSYRVGLFSFETKPPKLYARMLAQATGIPFADIKRSTVEEDDCGKIIGFANNAACAGHSLDVISAAGMSVTDVRAIALAQRYQVVILDYLQIIAGENRRGEKEYDRVTEASMALHTFAASTGTMVIELSQLSRDKNSKDRRPRLSDLRSSGQIEQDADLVLALSLVSQKERSGNRYLDILKNKEGSCGMLELSFDPERMTMLPVSKRHEPGNYSRREKYPEERDE